MKKVGSLCCWTLEGDSKSWYDSSEQFQETWSYLNRKEECARWEPEVAGSLRLLPSAEANSRILFLRGEGLVPWQMVSTEYHRWCYSFPRILSLLHLAFFFQAVIFHSTQNWTYTVEPHAWTHKRICSFHMDACMIITMFCNTLKWRGRLDQILWTEKN